jgi:hypothetical protein
MEILIAIAITTLAACGMALGLFFGRGPARTSCGAADAAGIGRCADCPLRRAAGKDQP